MMHLHWATFLFSSALLLANLTSCQFFHRPQAHQEVPPEEFGREYTVDQLNSDLDFLVQTLEDVHPNLHVYVTHEAFIQKHRAIEQKLISPLTCVEFYLQVAPLVAMLRDGHTKVYPIYEEYFHYIGEDGLLFPLDLEFREGKTIVVANYSPDPVPAPGSRILSINGIEIGSILDDLLPLVSGKRIEKRLEYLSDFFRHLLWLTSPSQGPFTLRFVSSEASEFQEHTVPGVTYWNIQKQKQSKDRQEADYIYRTLKDSSIALLVITVFPDEDEGFEEFLEESFADLQQKGIPDLIIDIRDNGGGYSPAAMELIRYLAGKPVARLPRMDIKVSRQIKEYYRQSLPSLLRWFPLQWFHPTWRKIWNAPEGSIVTISSQPERLEATPLRFDGNLYVLIGPGTFSTATYFAAMVKDYQLGELVGAETGGLATSFGDFYPFDLPNTRLLVRVSHKRIFRPNGADTGRGVLPDHPVAGSLEHIAQRVDPVLEYAIDLIESRGVANRIASG
jgi:hypothetical protein